MTAAILSMVVLIAEVFVIALSNWIKVNGLQWAQENGPVILQIILLKTKGAGIPVIGLRDGSLSTLQDLRLSILLDYMLINSLPLL